MLAFQYFLKTIYVVTWQGNLELCGFVDQHVGHNHHWSLSPIDFFVCLGLKNDVYETHMDIALHLLARILFPSKTSWQSQAYFRKSSCP
ncbi:hypothetical protein TNIN_282301 [Trichonephila inaurata madagascariensis]|uniref:Uncharacterized protein n=1 Tax=Trichonephila inaurata madagascariensis TaxID=2747483 RepID=A0A8X6Y163_9ARAC|nr:hypothetical protein TNIN_282301 [Trichonephila inaurata madagascariensis]